MEIKFSISRSNLLSRDRNLLSPDRICYIKIKFTISRSIQFTKSRTNFLSRDRIHYLEIEFTTSRSNILSEDQIHWVAIQLSKPRSNLLSRDRICYPEMDAFHGKSRKSIDPCSTKSKYAITYRNYSRLSWRLIHVQQNRNTQVRTWIIFDWVDELENSYFI